MAPLLRAPLPGHGNRTRGTHPRNIVACVQGQHLSGCLHHLSRFLRRSLVRLLPTWCLLHHSTAIASIKQATNSRHKTVWVFFSWLIIPNLPSLSLLSHRHCAHCVNRAFGVFGFCLEVCVGSGLMVGQRTMSRRWLGWKKEKKRKKESGVWIGSMGRGLVRGAIRGWKAFGSICGNRTLTTCRAVILPRFGGPEVTPYSRGLYVELGVLMFS